MMEITFRWAICPADLEEEHECPICREPVEARTVWPQLLVPHPGILDGIVCDECLKMLSSRHERFPTLADYQRLLERHPEPMYATDEEYLELERRDVWFEAHDRSRLEVSAHA